MLSGHVDIVTCAITNPSGQVSENENVFNENDGRDGDVMVFVIGQDSVYEELWREEIKGKDMLFVVVIDWIDGQYIEIMEVENTRIGVQFQSR